jgi:hypothetical protein
MDKPQSWTFLLSMNHMIIPDADKKTRTNQDSPLRLATREDALAFGESMFEPPLSVLNVLSNTKMV